MVANLPQGAASHRVGNHQAQRDGRLRSKAGLRRAIATDCNYVLLWLGSVILEINLEQSPMKCRAAASLFGFFFLVVGCATPYGETGFAGGYESNWLAPDVLSVDVSGNGFTSDRRVKDYALLQAAERGQQAGYKFFTMLQNDNQGGVDTYFVPPTATTTTTANIYGNSLYATSNTTTTGGVQQVYKPSRSMVVRMYNEVPEGYLAGQYFAIDEILLTIGEKYLPKK